jgi:peroxiredoxin
MDKKTHRTAKTFGFIVLVFCVGVAGVLVGNVLRGYFSGSRTTNVTAHVPRSLLRLGMVFPNVEVVGEKGDIRRTGDLLGSGGSVVLFLDLECPPCNDMALKWQSAVDKREVEAERVWGITFHSTEVIRTYKAENGLRFPIFTDSLQTFLRDYEVNRFPLEVIVGASGKIRSTSYDSESPIDLARLAGLFSDGK